MLDREAERAGTKVRGLVQINTSGEETKGGFSMGEVVDSVARICELQNLRIEGLMTMAPLTEDEAMIRTTFARARQAFDACARDVTGFEAKHLSMGMSHDFEMAVEEGSNDGASWGRCCWRRTFECRVAASPTRPLCAVWRSALPFGSCLGVLNAILLPL